MDQWSTGVGEEARNTHQINRRGRMDGWMDRVSLPSRCAVAVANISSFFLIVCMLVIDRVHVCIYKIRQ
jgi:hypothetical protein